MSFQASPSSPVSAALPEATGVVIIDDDTHILDAFSTLLELEGYQVSTFTSARAYLEARALSFGPPPSCILCDLVIPEMDGLELQSYLSQQDDIALILMSGSGSMQQAIQGFRSGAIDFLIKPISSELLLQSIQRAVTATGQRRERISRQKELSAMLNALTARELEVMRLVATGMTNLGVSIALEITERTVKFHRQRILEKLSFSGTAELVRLANELEHYGLNHLLHPAKIDDQQHKPGNA
jgi:FixJ family two-component response regulator